MKPRPAVLLITLFLFCGASPRETPVVRVVKSTAPSVVNISTERVVLLQQHPSWGRYGNMMDSLFTDFFQPYGAMKLQSLGSGAVVSDDGVIVTNAHVIHMASKIFAILHDGTTLEAALLGVSQQDDIALIKVDPPKKLKAVEIAGDIIIGETAIAIGNPLGLQNSVTVGVVSGTNRTFFSPATKHVFSSLIQTDAAINFGSSGGPLLNLEGKLIGINLAVAEGASNIGFAVPGEKVRLMLEEYEKVKTGRKVIRVPVQ